MTNIQTISTGLKLAADGIWYSEETETVSYPPDGNDICFSVEDNSFWFGHRNNCINTVVKFYPPKSNETIFDIGGGNGFVARGLIGEGYDVVLVEPGIMGCHHAKQRGVENVICATTTSARFKQHSLPAVGLFDIVEHIHDDFAFLQSMSNLLKKGGYLYITVPAYSFLWSDEDDFAGHCKRYTLEGISDVLKSAGFSIEFSSYIFRFLPLPVFLLRTLPYKLRISNKTRNIGNTNTVPRHHLVKRGLSSRVLDFLCQQEINSLDNKKSMKFGGSCLIVAKYV
jgi:SAM-dependent methyltransferase